MWNMDLRRAKLEVRKSTTGLEKESRQGNKIHCSKFISITQVLGKKLGLMWQFSGYDFTLPLQWTCVQSLVMELRCQHGLKKINK